MDEQKLTKEEKKAIRKLEWEEKSKQDKQSAVIKKYSIWAGGLLLVVLAIVGMFWLVTTPSPTPGQTQSYKIAPISARDIAEGNTSSRATLIEYADFQCPACADYHTIIDQVITTYGNKLRYVYRMFPLTQTHPNSHISAQAAYAALKQAAFFKYGDLLFSKQNEWADLQDPTTAFTDYAKKLNLDVSKFKTAMTSDEAKNYVNASEQEALSEGLDHTPTFLLNGKVITPGNFDDFKKSIDSQLAQK